MGDNKVFMTLRKTRKAYLIEYSCGLFILLLLGVLWLKGFELRSGVRYFALGLTLVSFALPEYNRMLTRYNITDSKLIITYGIIKKQKLNVYWAPLGFVPNINSMQNRVQRFLNYGTVYIASGGDPKNNFQIRDVNKPHKILKIVEDLVNSHRHGAAPEEKV